MILPPPSSTLFPYTTLFRSDGVRAREREQLGELIAQPEQRRELVLDVDRKSTRLNSSHVEISYAVFCLKKKKRLQRVIGFLSTCDRCRQPSDNIQAPYTIVD